MKISDSLQTPACYQDDIEQSVFQLFLKQVHHYSQHLAVSSKKYSWSYNELCELANRFAAAFSNQVGNKNEAPIVLLMEHDAPCIAAMLAALKIGAIYVPLDATMAPDRLQLIVADVEPGLIVTDNKNIALAASVALTCPVLIADNVVFDLDATSSIMSRASSPAYLIYTSGTTGEPKGVLQNHRNLLYYNRIFSHALNIKPSDRIAVLASFSCDAAVMDIYAALLNGAGLRIFPLKEEGPTACLQWLQDEVVTIYHSTPTVFRLLMETSSRQASWCSLRWVVLGGEIALEQDFVFYSTVCSKECKLLNGLGPTEATVALQYSFVSSSQLSSATLPVGFPVTGTTLFLCDDHGNINANEGEILIACPYLALGYWRDQTLTEENFVWINQRRVFRSGDLGARLPSGAIEFIGRKNDQIKIRGQKVFLRQIESLLAGKLGMRQIVVAPFTNSKNNVELVAFYTAHQELSRLCLLQEVKQVLSEPMIPVNFVRINEIPFKANGKIDYQALPFPQLYPVMSQFIIDQHSVTQKVKQVWMQLLSLQDDELTDNANFFSSGGHSLLAMELLLQLQATLNIKLSLATLLRKPTIAGIVDAIAATDNDSNFLDDELPALVAVSRGNIVPTSFIQEDFCVVQHLNEADSRLNLVHTFEIRGNLKVDDLTRALEKLIQAHDILRTSLHFIAGEFKQVIHEEILIPWEYLDLSAQSECQAQNRAIVILNKELRTPYKLECAPLFRIKLLRLSPSLYQLLLSWHHGIADGWSEAIFTEQLSRLYNAQDVGNDEPLLLPFQYADYSIWQRQCLQENSYLERLCSYWRPRLENIPSLLSSTNGKALSELDPRIQTYTVPLPDNWWTGVNNYCANNKVTVFMFALAVYSVTIHKLTGDQDIVITTPFSQRKQPSLHKLLGCFINLIFIRVNCQPTMTFAAILNRVAEEVVGAFENADFPYKLMLELIRKTNAAYNNISYMLAVHNHPAPRLQFNDLVSDHKEHNPGAGIFYQSIDLIPTQNGMSLTISYDTTMFSEQDIIKMAQTFIGVSELSIADDLKLISQWSISTKPQLTKRHDCWNQPTVKLSSLKCTVQDLYDSTAMKYSNSLALSQDQQNYTYQQLNNKIDCLLNFFSQRNLMAGDKVVVFLPRGINLIKTMLAIFKLGAIYIPVDPENSGERINYILQDSDPKLIIIEDDSHKITQFDSLYFNINNLIKNERPTGVNFCSRLPEDPAYIIYTSGTTGKPKGVVIPHRALTNLILWRLNQFGLQPTDRSMLFSSPGFDNFMVESWPFLVSGASIHVVSPDKRKDPTALISWLNDNAITHCELTPSYGALLLTLSWPATTKLKHMFLGGERLAHFPRKSWPFSIWNIYGTTETAVDALYCQVYPNNAMELESPPIGKPLSNVKAYILDASLQPVPMGTVGELYLGGAGVGLGYLNQPELTKERFLHDPFAITQAGTLFKTGDMVRRRTDGQIEYLYRCDGQVKVDGFRIEITEIENCLLNHPDINATHILPHKDGCDGVQLVAFLVAENERQLAPKDLRYYVKKFLPHYMIPAHFIYLQELPRTINEKIDADALAVYFSSLKTRTESQDNRDELVTVLLALWQQVLSFSILESHSNFFEVGGSSLKAILLITKINDHFSLALSPAWILEYPTVAEQAFILQQPKPKFASNLISWNKEGIKLPLFLIPPGNTAPDIYSRFASSLASDQPCYALNSYFIYSKSVSASPSIEEMATFYATLIKDILPGGPYLLGGWSMGGLIAYEASQQLVDNGYEVKLLILWDSWVDESQSASLPDPFYKMKVYGGDVILFKSTASSEVKTITIKDNGFKQWVSNLSTCEINANHYNFFTAKTISDMLDFLRTIPAFNPNQQFLVGEKIICKENPS